MFSSATINSILGLQLTWFHISQESHEEKKVQGFLDKDFE